VKSRAQLPSGLTPRPPTKGARGWPPASAPRRTTSSALDARASGLTDPDGDRPSPLRFDSPTHRSPTHRAIATLCYGAGLRSSEACALHAEDTDGERLPPREPGLASTGGRAAM